MSCSQMFAAFWAILSTIILRFNGSEMRTKAKFDPFHRAFQIFWGHLCLTMQRLPGPVREHWRWPLNSRSKYNLVFYAQRLNRSENVGLEGIVNCVKYSFTNNTTSDFKFCLLTWVIARNTILCLYNHYFWGSGVYIFDDLVKLGVFTNVGEIRR